MSIASIVLRGYGNGSVVGSISEVVTRGYTIGVIPSAAPFKLPDSSVGGGGGGGGAGKLQARSKAMEFKLKKRASEEKFILKFVQQFMSGL